MAPLSFQSGMNYAKALLPETLRRSVQTVQTTISRHILPSHHPRCYRVCSQSRRRRRSLVASSLDELLQQAARVFTACCWDDLTLVLEEDGTVVDSEEFLQSLSGSAQLMVLSRGEMWTHSKILPSFREPRKSGVAKLTFDLYKLHPEAFLCCLGVRATLYKTYSLSYDFRCTRAKHVLRWVLRCLGRLTRLAARLLLCVSSFLLQLTADEQESR
ncbi:cell death activator CIDE-A-like [Kryptolebias marmoratus]|uniref:cell death activator CIDE-A-like n=1 Tax=Kryptolebias marmoratus TaxID=37003 RepID=UPI000D52F223|nr:cell death activator CIDE-A-like [Kryptolebias marmoratus]